MVSSVSFLFADLPSFQLQVYKRLAGRSERYSGCTAMAELGCGCILPVWLPVCRIYPPVAPSLQKGGRVPSACTSPIAQWSFEKRAFSSFHLHKTLQPFDRLTIVLLHVSLRSLLSLSNKDSSLVGIIQTHNIIFLSSARQSSFSGFAPLWDDPQKGRNRASVFSRFCIV